MFVKIRASWQAIVKHGEGSLQITDAARLSPHVSTPFGLHTVTIALVRLMIVATPRYRYPFLIRVGVRVSTWFHGSIRVPR